MGVHLKIIRKRKFMTLQELAKLSKVSKSEIAYIEKDMKSPTVETLCKLAKALDVNVHTLFDCDEAVKR